MEWFDGNFCIYHIIGKAQETENSATVRAKIDVNLGI